MTLLFVKYTFNTKLFILIVFSIFIIASCQTTVDYKPIDFVNPLIGTAPSNTESALKNGINKENNAQVVPSVTMPFGMTNWTPETQATEKKCIAPYYYKDSIILGFRGSHWLSGSCVQDYGSMTIMPAFGALNILGYGSKYSHSNEMATPYKYEVLLDDYNIYTEMTSTKRCGLFRFTYKKNGEGHIIIHINSDYNQGFIKIDTLNHEIIGFNPVHRIYQGAGKYAGFNGYFVARYNIKNKNLEASFTKSQTAYLSFKIQAEKQIEIRVGTSFTSINEARKNLNTETNNITFDKAVKNLKSTWNNLLSKIEVSGSSKDDKIKFYTALYHSYLQPRIFNDCDGSYPRFAGGKQIMHTPVGHDYYCDFSMWDTYRASIPLFNLLTPNKSKDMMYSLLDKARQGDWLPIFPCWNSYTSAMIGDHAIAAIADTYMKGLIDLSDEQYKYLLQNAYTIPKNIQDYKDGKGRRALKSYLKYGYIPYEDKVLDSYHKEEQVSRTLEYAFDDYCLARIAEKKGDTLHAKDLYKRSKNYKNVYNSKDSCVNAKYENGNWYKKLDKYNRQPFITEGTPYQYTWYVPQDIKGLVKLMGGPKAFEKNLDHFKHIKQYWHGNEPSHQIPFLYNYVGQGWKSQKWVNEIMHNEYSSSNGGLSGNDDSGQMSAWYVFAAIGFYPVCPASNEYAVSGPHFDKVIIHLENGKEFTMITRKDEKDNYLINSMRINNKLSYSLFINYNNIINGDSLTFIMSNNIN